eukprot:10853591-Ditylum_brightwellii.AAC.1
MELHEHKPIAPRLLETAQKPAKKKGVISCETQEAKEDCAKSAGVDNTAKPDMATKQQKPALGR